MTAPITVVIPVGPRAEDCAYLVECLASVPEGTPVMVVDDMHEVGCHDQCAAVVYRKDLEWHHNPWNLGVAASFNVGVALAPTEHVLLLGADDVLQPDAIERAQAAIEANPYEQAYYWYHVRYLDDRPEPLQAQPCGAAVVTKALWRATGGFPVEAAVGRSDVMLVGLLMGHPEAGTLVEITDGGEPPYHVRTHAGQHTASRGPWVHALEATADAYWRTWTPPAWGRYS